MTTDTDRLNWLIKRVTYLEHCAADGTSCAKTSIGGYWPRGEYKEDNADPDMVDLTLLQYIDAMIRSGK